MVGFREIQCGRDMSIILNIYRVLNMSIILNIYRVLNMSIISNIYRAENFRMVDIGIKA